MTTANRIIRGALGKIGIVTPGEAVKAGDAADCLVALNAMLDAWQVERLFAYATQTIVGTLPSGTATRTIGPTGDLLCTPRPVAIELGSFFRTGSNDYPLRTVTEEEYNSITVKGVGSLGPAVVSYTASLPNGVLRFFPQAASPVTLNLQVMVQISAFVDLTTDYLLPPGYERALVLSLAEEVASDYEHEMSQALRRQGVNARRMIKTMNVVVPQLDVGGDQSLTSRAYLFGGA